MSILIEKIAKSGEPQLNLYPPGDVTIISKYSEKGSIYIEWKDPDDTIIDEIILSEWSHTLLIRKQGSYPTSPSDGDVVIDNYERNKYANTEFIDSGLDDGITYYYRFFVYSTNEECNSDPKMTFNIVNKLVDTNLSNNDWSTIISIANQGKAQNYWKVGDEISLKLGSPYSVTVVLQIWDFNHFNYASDTSKPVNICFGLKDCYFEDIFNRQTGLTKSWNTTYLHDRMDTIFNSIPSPVKDNIKEVAVYTYNGLLKGMQLTLEKVFIPSDSEIGENEYSPVEGFLLPIFKDGHVRGLYRKTGSPSYSSETSYWLRSRSDNDHYDGDVCCTYKDGSGVFFGSADFNEHGILFCFNI